MRTIKNNLTLFLIIIFSVLVFSPSLDNYFWGDDWYHLKVSQVENVGEFLNFFSFSQTAQSTPFYRPISTQVPLFTLYQVFNLNPIPYHVVLMIIFACTLYLIYRLSKMISNDSVTALLTVFFYGFSSTNFYRLYYISNLQEVLMVFFLLIAFINYLKNSTTTKILSIFFFILALGSKETAIVLPAFFLSYDFINKKMSVKKILPFLLLSALYIGFRLLSWSTLGKDSYDFDFSFLKILNTSFWYTLWAFGVPEFLVDYVGKGLQILPKLYKDFPVWSHILLILTSLTIISFSMIILLNLKQKRSKMSFFFPASFFVVGLLPVIFLPWHKFAYELTLPMVGFSLMLACLIRNISRYGRFFMVLFLVLYILLNAVTYFLNYNRHYSITRSQISRRVVDYFNTNYPFSNPEIYFEFVNDTPDYGTDWGSSKQISQAISQSNLFKVLYQDPFFEVYFEDFPGKRPQEKERIPVSTAIFLK